jgi:hypothetical protein
MSRPVANPVVMGRKICSGCRRWRPISDFYVSVRWPDDTPRSFQSHCATCQRRGNRVSKGVRRRGRPYQANRPAMSAEQRAARRRALYAEHRQDPVWAAARREDERIYREAKRREAGVPARRFKHRRTVIDQPEYAFLEAARLLDEVRRADLSDLELARIASCWPRTIHRLRVGESRHVRLDVADKLAHALGIPLALIYGDTPARHGNAPVTG